jgi:hypothetical protein
MSSLEWRHSRPTIKAFFDDGWKHGRIDDEIKKADEKYERLAEAGRKGGSAKRGLSDASATPELLTTTPTPTQETDKKDLLVCHEKGGGDKVEKPPPNGAQSKKFNTVFYLKDQGDWAAFAADYEDIRGHPPFVNKWGGFWFYRPGEALRPIQHRAGGS